MGDLFRNEAPITELVARAAIFYFMLIFLKRLAPRRASGRISHTDIIFTILLVEPAARSLGDSASILDAFIQITTFVGCHVILNFATFHWRWLENLLDRPPVKVIEDGKLLRANMARELISKRELLANLREEGCQLKDVKCAQLEGDGELSVITKEATDDA